MPHLSIRVNKEICFEGGYREGERERGGERWSRGEMEDASTLLKYAEQSEGDGYYGDAVSYYKRAMEQFLNIASTLKDEHRKGGILETVCLISRRVEALQTSPPSRRLTKSVSGGGGGGAHSYKNDGGDKCDTTEEDSMRSQIEALRLDPSKIKPVAWDDVVGMESTKKLLIKSVRVYNEMPHLIGGMRKAPTGILLYGPPGVGKTYIVNALATDCKRAFFNVPCEQLRSKYLGDSGKLIGAMFDVVRKSVPAILFIDEIDALCGDRDSGQQHGESSKALNTLLSQMDGLGNTMDGILLIGGTNRPHDIDGAMLRRFSRCIYTPLPSPEDRYELLKHSLSKNKGDYGPPIEDNLLKELAGKMQYFSNADIVKLVENAYESTWDTITEATHFRPVVSPSDPSKVCVIPCKPGDQGAKAITYSQIRDTSPIIPLALTYENLRDTLPLIKLTTNEKSIRMFEEWGSSL